MTIDNKCKNEARLRDLQSQLELQQIATSVLEDNFYAEPSQSAQDAIDESLGAESDIIGKIVEINAKIRRALLHTLTHEKISNNTFNY